MNGQHKDTQTTQKSLFAARQGRRRFLGAGTVAAPFILTMVSNPALGKTCFTPSRSLSRNTSISQQGKYGDCLNAQSPGNYAAQQTQGNGNSYSWPASVPPTTPFHPTFLQVGTNNGPTSFIVPLAGGGTRFMTMGEVLTIGADQDGQKVAKHLLGAYLNTKGGGNSVIPPNVLTAQGVLDIWSAYARLGYFEPTAGVRWNGEDIKTYLLSNGIVT